MSSASNALPDEVWEAARLIWENTTKITDNDLIEQLAAKFGDDAPRSNGAVSKRRKNEGWVKNNLEAAKKRVAKRQVGAGKNSNPRKKNTEKNGKFPSKTNKAQNTEKKLTLEEKKHAIETVIDDVVLDAKGRAKIIQKYRKRYVRAGDVFDQALDITLEIKSKSHEVEQAQIDLLALSDSDSYGADFEIGENSASFDKQLERAQNRLDLATESLQKSMVLSKVLTDTANNLATGLKSLSEVDLTMCGVTAEDFKESDQARRLGMLSLLDGISEKENKERIESRDELYERLKEFEAMAASGDFERDLANADEDIEDIDYTAID